MYVDDINEQEAKQPRRRSNAELAFIMDAAHVILMCREIEAHIVEEREKADGIVLVTGPHQVRNIMKLKNALRNAINAYYAA